MSNPWDNDEIIRAAPSAPAAGAPSAPMAAPTHEPQVQQAARQPVEAEGAQAAPFWEKDALIRPAPSANTAPAQAGVPTGGTPAPGSMAPAPPQSLAQIAADYTKSVGRQVGLTARYGMEGLGQAAEVVTEPVRHLVTDPAMRAIGAPEGRPLGQAMAGIADRLGLPKPANETERVVGDAARFMAGGAGVAGAAGKAAQAFAPVAASFKAAGPLETVAQAMAANPGMQIAGSAGAGIGAGLAREAGGGEGAQLAAGLAGGLSVSGLVQAARSGVQSASVLLPIRAK